MVDPITIRVLTQAGLVTEDQAVSVIVPGEPGYLGILRNHAPLVTILKPGKLTWRHAGGSSRTVRIGAGLLEVERNRVTILTESVTEPTQAEARI